MKLFDWFKGKKPEEKITEKDDDEFLILVAAALTGLAQRGWRGKMGGMYFMKPEDAAQEAIRYAIQAKPRADEIRRRVKAKQEVGNAKKSEAGGEGERAGEVGVGGDEDVEAPAVPGVQGKVEAPKAGDSGDSGVDAGKGKAVRLVSSSGRPIGGGVA